MIGDTENAKLDELEARIRRAGTPHFPSPEDSGDAGDRRVGYEFIGAVLGGVFLGLALDTTFPKIAPWGLIGMLVLGFIAGIYAVWRALEMKKTGS